VAVLSLFTGLHRKRRSSSRMRWRFGLFPEGRWRVFATADLGIGADVKRICALALVADTSISRDVENQIRGSTHSRNCGE
jgi:hypothetical protein